MKKLCFAKEVFKAVCTFENQLKREYSISLNEALTLCALRDGKMNTGRIAEEVGISISRMSRVIGSLEKKHYISRHLGKKDRRTMFFGLSETGREKLEEIDDSSLDFPYFDDANCS